MASILQFFIIAATIATIFGQTINVTTSAQDYYLLSQRELLHEILIVENDVLAVDARYADQRKIIDFQQEQLLTEIEQTNRTLVTLQALSYSYKYCIQQYSSQLVTYDNAKLKMKACSDKAATTANTLTTNPKTNVASARTQVLVTLPRNIASCDTANSKNQTALELCYITNVNLATTNVNVQLNTASDLIIKSLYDATIASQTAVKCSFLVEKDTLQAIGKVNKSVDNCLGITRQTTTAALSTPDGVSVRNLIMGAVTKK